MGSPPGGTSMPSCQVRPGTSRSFPLYIRSTPVTAGTLVRVHVYSVQVRMCSVYMWACACVRVCMVHVYGLQCTSVPTRYTPPRYLSST
jgi:hypothetical protein